MLLKRLNALAIRRTKGTAVSVATLVDAKSIAAIACGNVNYTTYVTLARPVGDNLITVITSSHFLLSPYVKS